MPQSPPKTPTSKKRGRKWKRALAVAWGRSIPDLPPRAGSGFCFLPCRLFPRLPPPHRPQSWVSQNPDVRKSTNSKVASSLPRNRAACPSRSHDGKCGAPSALAGLGATTEASCPANARAPGVLLPQEGGDGGDSREEKGRA